MSELEDALEAIKRGVVPRELESDRLEFKQEDSDLRSTLESIADAVVCLANARGGTILVGVSDRPNSEGRVFLGLSSALSIDAVRRGIFDRTRPPLSVPVSDLEEGGQRVLVITVPQGVPFYSNAKGTSTRRLGAQCLPFTPEEQRQAAAARGYTDWSSEYVDAGLDALSGEELGRVRRLLTLAGREDSARADNRKLLRDLRLIGTDGRLTRAGVLLLGTEEEIARLIPTYGYAYQYRSTPGSEASARFRGNRPILAAVDALLDAVATRTQVHPINMAGGVQLQIRDFPPDAVRELVVNGLVHRDFELEGETEIEHSPESLTVSSPGGLVFGVTPENILTHPSTPRHRLLLETITALQVAERTGQGIDRAYRELLRSGKRPPTILDDGVQVRVVVPGGTGNEAFSRFVAELPPEMSGDVDALLALAQLRDQRSIDAPTLATMAQRSAGEAQAVLERLRQAGLVEPTRRSARSAFPTYRLTAAALATLGRAVTYHARLTDDIDRKIVEHVEEYGHVTNQTLRRLFDLDIYAARNVISDLRSRRILEKLDAARGGPGVRYGPGPAFGEVSSRRR